uniref:WRKY transcription factor 19 n=1 Tax=Siraitia grosvenorii TaxID=190515 RepID=A0A3T0I8E7_SIRGR|nr:WRKY transcription factor 19 [Siraitia grosvenorii]
METAALPNSEDRVQSSGGDEEAAAKQDVLHKVPFTADLEKSSMEPLSVPSASSSWKEEDHHHEQRIKMAKAEMSQVKEENQRLKMCLDQIMKDYEALKRQFHDIIQREGKKSTQTSASTINDEVEEADDMVSLTLGRFSSDQNKNTSSERKDQKDHKLVQLKQDWGSLGLGDCKSRDSEAGERNKNPPASDHMQSPTESEAKEEEAGETWPPSKALKSLPAGEDEVSQQNPPKKARVCVRARCDTPTMNDGCQWRKYGQKIAKGNPCPRAYYRCTGAPSCPVRKQVQRSVDDISILITTYEGTHNHPLPVSAMAMASTTSAAASMLLSGPSSSTSRPGPPNPPSTAAAHLHGMNLYLSNNSNSKQFYLPNSSILSSSLNHPTITLDLTSNPPSTSSSSPFHKLPSSYPPKYPFTSLDFGSSQSNLMSWNNGGYGNQSAYGKSAIGMASDLAKQLPLHSNIYQACLQQISNPSTPSLPLPPPPPLPDTIAAATKAITSDPSFQSVLAAALSSIIGGGNSGEMISSLSSYLQTPQGNVCASSLLSKTPSVTSSQQGNMAFQPPPSLTCSTSKSPSSSPGDSRDNAK